MHVSIAISSLFLLSKKAIIKRASSSFFSLPLSLSSCFFQINIVACPVPIGPQSITRGYLCVFRSSLWMMHLARSLNFTFSFEDPKTKERQERNNDNAIFTLNASVHLMMHYSHWNDRSAFLLLIWECKIGLIDAMHCSRLETTPISPNP